MSDLPLFLTTQGLAIGEYDWHLVAKASLSWATLTLGSQGDSEIKSGEFSRFESIFHIFKEIKSTTGDKFILEWLTMWW